ncbi:hypothetical protein ATE69_13650 [Sphingopyxis sp. H071]|nr:hypothetical protein ATE61_14350 [Sphingopyxis sp. H057]KTE50391.1 hypothetical protein ATE64_16270 [Sphingopyxis sp. H073]KTE52480.1 hypothetical protein ATE69_13650 [Sphingopyxis sp. H071]KTE62973.1 hypothetical protein ATE66_01170 [Sphingopyxis sp. H107]KTE64861.1 hypothetical protein ATE65_10405 [Sphingopyxis sp. H100]KTE72205.1 hypothetical protein ATE60_10400 [Sphingopyxis sp. H081]KTE79736.1 hypothetical protein ATE63_13820 [Sphingopyxis sp. H067]
MRYLARNENFQAEYAAALGDVESGITTADDVTTWLIASWGLSYPVDPNAPHDMSRIHVQPALSPVTLELTDTPASPSPHDSITPANLGLPHHCLQCGDIQHLILANAAGDIRVTLSCGNDGPLGLQLPLDRDLHVRLAATERLRRHISGLACGPPPLLLTHLKQQRLLVMLRAWDGRASGASARELAAVLIDARVASYGAALWSDSRQRRQIGRWLSDARKLIYGGYLSLLRGE